MKRARSIVVHRARSFGLLVMLSGGLVPLGQRDAQAQAATQPAQLDNVRRADALFNAGKAAYKAGDFDGAHDKFQASLLLDPSASTKLWIARCLEHEEKLTAAASTYREALELNRELKRNPANRERLQAVIEEELAALEQRIPKIIVRVSPSVEGLQVALDGTLLAPDMLDHPVEVDPGNHTLQVTAPEYRPVSRTETLSEKEAREESFSLERVIDSVEPAPQVEAEPRRRSEPAIAPPATSARVTVNSARPGDHPRPSSQRVWAWSIGALGVGSLAASGYFAAHTLLLVNQADCNADWVCSKGGAATIQQAGREQTRAIVAGVIGAAAISASVVLLVTLPSPRRSEAKARIEFGLYPTELLGPLDMVTGPTLDEPLCEDLVMRAVAGDATASRRLVEVLWPWLVVLVSTNRSMRGRADNEDEVRNVVTQIVAKVLRGLRLYPKWRQANQSKSIADWTRILAKNCMRDYLRERLGSRSAPGEEPSVKRFLNDFTAWEELDDPGERPPRTLAQTAREVLEFAAAHLPRLQVAALALWLEGATAVEIGTGLSVTAAEATRLVRAAVMTLRRHFERDDLK